MSTRLTNSQIEDLLIYCGSSPTHWKDDDMLVCCPVHGESNPSMGVSSDLQIVHCFSCHFAGDFTKLLLHSRPDDFRFDKSTEDTIKKTGYKAYRKAKEFLALRYELEYHELGKRVRSVKRYEDRFEHYFEDTKRSELPMFKLAPLKSGKETYKYFFDRGFTKQEMIDFKIGRDLINETVTIPVFYEDDVLAGIIGRYIAKNRKKNQRYKIYDGFERSSLLYPLNKSKPINDTIILVEGQFDAIRMHRAGHTNTYSTMTNDLSKAQAEWLCDNCSTVIWIGDNDSRGIEGRDKAYTQIKDKVKFKIVDYPTLGKDVCDWTDEEIEVMIETAHSPLVRKFRRLE